MAGALRRGITGVLQGAVAVTARSVAKVVATQVSRLTCPAHVDDPKKYDEVLGNLVKLDTKKDRLYIMQRSRKEEYEDGRKRPCGGEDADGDKRRRQAFASARQEYQASFGDIKDNYQHLRYFVRQALDKEIQDRFKGSPPTADRYLVPLQGFVNDREAAVLIKYGSSKGVEGEREIQVVVTSSDEGKDNIHCEVSKVYIKGVLAKAVLLEKYTGSAPEGGVEAGRSEGRQ